MVIRLLKSIVFIYHGKPCQLNQDTVNTDFYNVQ